MSLHVQNKDKKAKQEVRSVKQEVGLYLKNGAL